MDNSDAKRQRPHKTGRESNMLKGAERFKLWNALVEAKGELDAIHADMTRAAEMMTQRLGFKVTNNNVKDAIAQGIVDWDRSHRHDQSPMRAALNDLTTRLSENTGSVVEHENLLSDLSGRVKALEDRMASVEDIVLRLVHVSGTGEKVEVSDKGPMRAPDAWVSK